LSELSLLLIGFSHAGALRVAQLARVERKAATSQLTTIFLFPKYDPLLKVTDGKHTLHEDIEPDLRRTVEELKPQFIIGAFWGNQNYFPSTANSPRRFDFVLPSEPDLPTDAAAEIVPYDLMLGFVRDHFTLVGRLIAATQKITRLPLYLLPAPPPVDDLSAISGGKFDVQMESLVAEHGFAPGWLRYKFWRLCHSVHQEKAAAAKVEVLPIPAEAVDERGFRRPEHYSKDWIHANAAYGEFMLKQCDALLARS